MQETERIAVNRRLVLAGLVATAAAGKVEARPSARDEVDRAARDLAGAMQALHGGEWSVRVSHDLGYAAVSRNS